MEKLPPFPEELPTVPIARIDYSQLRLCDPKEAQRALQACQTDGFFYLDLTSSHEGQQLLSESEQLLELSKAAFKAPLEEKMGFRAQRGVSLFGYKPAGTVKKTDKDQRPDTTEFFNISKDHLFGVTESRTYPDTLLASKGLMQNFTKHCHETGMLILSTLARQLGIPESDFLDKNIFESPSGDHIRLTKKAPHNVSNTTVIGLPSHTDFGSVTILFNWLGGLQIQSHDPATDGEWAYVKPLPGHAIINLGDAMVKFSNGNLKSAKHRVVPAPGAQANVDRYSLVYFVRPADDILMEPVQMFRGKEVVKVGGKVGEERVYTAGEWMVRRLQQLASAEA